MNNAEWMIKRGYKFKELTWKRENIENFDYDILLNNKCIGKVEDTYPSLVIQTWLDMEHIEPILDDTERRYLSAVIRPFRNKIKHIAKHGGNYHDYYYEYITVMYYVDQVLTTYSFGLPIFSEGTMYKGMENGRTYTLEELEL